MGLSSFSTTPLEEVVAAAKEKGDIDHVLQLYVMKNRRTSETLVRRAESMCNIISPRCWILIRKVSGGCGYGRGGNQRGTKKERKKMA